MSPSNLLVLLISIFSKDAEPFSISRLQFGVKNEETTCARPVHSFSRELVSLNNSLNDDDRESDGRIKKVNKGTSEFGRRGALKSLLGGAFGLASISTNIGAVLIGTATNTVGGSALAALYQRVLSFGAKNAAAIASDDLLTWIASQTGGAAATPEIQAWLAAQRKLQSMKRVATVISGTATATSRRAVSGGLIEEVVLAAAAGKVVNSAINNPENEDVTVDSNNIEQGSAENVLLTKHEDDCKTGDEMSISSTKVEDA